MAKIKGNVEAQDGVFGQPTSENEKLSQVEDQEHKELEPSYLTTQQARAISKVERDLFKKNNITMRVSIIDKFLGEKKAMIDKETGVQKVDKYTGESLYWPQKTYISYSFEGGTNKQEIDSNIYHSIQDDVSDYIATGIFAVVNTYDGTMGFKINSLIPFDLYLDRLLEKHVFVKK